MFHMKPPGAGGGLGLLLALAVLPAAIGAGCTLLLVEPACLFACEAAVVAAPPASGVAR